MQSFGKFMLSVFLTIMLTAKSNADVQPIPQTVQYDKAKAMLGEKLYNDKRLSVDGTISCESCHHLDKAGIDHAVVSGGVQGKLGVINAPTVFNSAHNFVQFWDGRAKDLQQQALGPVENPLEMGEKWPHVVEKISSDAEYVKLFKTSYDGKITKETIADAIAEFEKTLITPNSKFDQYLRGDKTALSPKALQGYMLFQQKGCTACHSGDYFGGEMYQQLNPEYFKDRKTPMTTADLGRFNVTHQEQDKHVFKVPMLRNVAATEPYFHDGQVKTLDDAVLKMGKYQLRQDLKPAEVQAIVAFLQSLTGTYKGVPLDKNKP